ncbi:hypothetical protein [Herbiconiux ginsengi]|uniref:Uncharacterized protein n=1 Tax=Herbiconiux ginsengi TaxID=381665 RepID=A0A1H3PR71_9MICO|nr:hypothetical protein [Herbiconiux ginsengi]SDZ03405.1 hypothetical protein SAMN05216554_2040 [Herbiconiux ginsengi]
MEINETTELPSRRTALKIGAWSVPVVALAVATPTAAASNETSTNIVYQSYAGWTGGNFVLEAYIRTRADNTPVAGVQVTWTVVETGQVFSATTSSSGFARVDAPPSTVVGTPGFVDIASLDATHRLQVQGERPPV